MNVAIFNFFRFRLVYQDGQIPSRAFTKEKFYIPPVPLGSDNWEAESGKGGGGGRGCDAIRGEAIKKSARNQGENVLTDGNCSLIGGWANERRITCKGGGVVEWVEEVGRGCTSGGGEKVPNSKLSQTQTHSHLTCCYSLSPSRQIYTRARVVCCCRDWNKMFVWSNWWNRSFGAANKTWFSRSGWKTEMWRFWHEVGLIGPGATLNFTTLLCVRAL